MYILICYIQDSLIIFKIFLKAEEVKEKESEDVKAEADSSVETSESKEENGKHPEEKSAEAEEKTVENGNGRFIFLNFKIHIVISLFNFAVFA